MVALAEATAAGLLGSAINGVLATGAAAGTATGVVAGAAIGLINAATTTGTSGALVAKATAAGWTSGALLGSVVVGASGTSAVAGALVASVTGAGAAGMTTTAIAGTSAVASILSGPVGWAILGATEKQAGAVYTFDCWKPVLRDESCEPSNGKLLREVAMDPRIIQVTTASNNTSDLPQLILQNIWDEQFRIEYVYLPSNQLAAHAVKI